ncbi:MAG: SAM-dependent methyltransferase [Planctomycetaceae bacterium]|nr:SAM-dependent methyltransferase [Planctomycetaceae bacterium]
MTGLAQSLTAGELTTKLQAIWPEFIEVVISQPRRNASTSTAESLRKVTGRPVVLKDGRRIQLTLQFEKRQTHENVLPQDAPIRCLSLLQQDFEHLHLFTKQSDIAVRRQRDGSYHWRQSRPTKVGTATELQVAHNRSKKYLIPENEPCAFLTEIGVMNREGQVLAAKQNKFRQINRFLELVNDVLPHLPRDREIQVVDFGSGKSYLTFALHHLLTRIHGRRARIRGVDLKADVIQNCSRIASDLQCEGLSFHHGDIAEFKDASQVDLMVSLHACDTATDAALAQAVHWCTPVILAVPCCQHEVAANLKPDAVLDTLTEHGILKERFAALATDALRVKILEICGYQTQIVEFIDLEHTPKNLLIRAVRRTADIGTISCQELLQSYADFKRLLGIQKPALERYLSDILLKQNAEVSRE